MDVQPSKMHFWFNHEANPETRLPLHTLNHDKLPTYNLSFHYERRKTTPDVVEEVQIASRW